MVSMLNEVNSSEALPERLTQVESYYKATKDKNGISLDITNILEPHIRDNVFPGVIHLFRDEPTMVEIDGPIHDNLVRNLTPANCVSQNPFMSKPSKHVWKLYLKELFGVMVQDRILHKVFNTRRSNMYGAMKYKFQSKLDQWR